MSLSKLSQICAWSQNFIPPPARHRVQIADLGPTGCPQMHAIHSGVSLENYQVPTTPAAGRLSTLVLRKVGIWAADHSIHPLCAWTSLFYVVGAAPPRFQGHSSWEKLSKGRFAGQTTSPSVGAGVEATPIILSLLHWPPESPLTFGCK